MLDFVPYEFNSILLLLCIAIQHKDKAMSWQYKIVAYPLIKNFKNTVQ